MKNDLPEASKQATQGRAAPVSERIRGTQRDDSAGPTGLRVVDTLMSAMLLAFTGGSLDAFLYLNHGHVYAGVMTGNAVLCGIAVFNRSAGGAMHYARPLLAYVCGILLIAIFQRYVRRHSVRFALSIVILGLLVMSLVPANFPEDTYIFLVVLLTGFLVGIARRVDTYSYNATVLTGSLRDATISLYQSLNPATRAHNLQEACDLWLVMLSFFSGAAAGGLLGRQIGNHALWLPLGVLALVLVTVLQGAKQRKDTAHVE